MKNSKKEKIHNVVWPSTESRVDLDPRFRPDEFEDFEMPVFEEDEDCEELYSAEICDWWEPFSEHYPVSKISDSNKDRTSNDPGLKAKPIKSNLSVKLMDMLNDDVVAKLQGIALA